MAGTASGLPEPVEDAVQFFLYRVQVGAALGGDRLSGPEIAGLVASPPTEAGPTASRVVAALAAAFARDRAQAPNAARKAAALGEAHEPPLDEWRRHRAALLDGAPPSRLRAAVAALELAPGLLGRLWRALRGR